MASALLSQCRNVIHRTVTGFSSTNLLAPMQQVLGMPPVRTKAKKSGGTTRNKMGRTRKKHRGVKAPDGSFVHKNDILVTQHGLKFYPGENVLMDERCTLSAAYDGVVVISTENMNPYPDSPLYAPIQNGLVMQKKFVSVIPTPLHGKFRLISQT